MEENNVRAYFDISLMLDKFYKNAHVMTKDQLLESSRMIQDFIKNHYDINSKLYQKGLKVLLEIFNEMKFIFKVESRDV